MQLPQQVRDRFSADDVPPQAYAVIGAGLALRERAAAIAQDAAGTGDRWLATGRQAGAQTRDRVEALPGMAVAHVRRRWSALLAAPVDIRDTVVGTVIDLRGRAAQEYDVMAARGERSVAQWQAERMLNQRADRMARSVTPAAAKATVSARDAARRAAATPTGQRLGQAGRRARARAGQAWQDYLNAVDASGAAQWGDAAVNGQPSSVLLARQPE